MQDMRPSYSRDKQIEEFENSSQFVRNISEYPFQLRDQVANLVRNEARSLCVEESA